jgi:L-ascorbate metabolism protein UlaG (beta-lactamase superfamily)
VRIRWYGQSAFLLSGEKSVFIDPFGDLGEAARSRGIEFAYPPVDAEADVLLVTHEHGDHNVVEAITGEPVVIRSAAGRHESPIGEVVGIASEHDDVAGTTRGANTIFCFTLDGVRCCHLGDFGQASLRPEQLEAIGDVDVLFVPAGGGPTIGGESAAAVVRAIGPRVVVPMHYRTERVNFLDPPGEFIEALGMPVTEVGSSEVEVDGLEGVVLFATP